MILLKQNEKIERKQMILAIIKEIQINKVREIIAQSNWLNK